MAHEVLFFPCAAFPQSDYLQHTFLMHSILALAASHLVRYGEPALLPAAHYHRLRAMQGVNELVTRGDRTSTEDDALIAACYALAFQVACIGEGPTAFWITVRTITVVKAEVISKQSSSMFGQYSAPERHTAMMADRLQSFPLLRRSLIAESRASLEAMRPLCQQGIEAQLFSLLIKTLDGLMQSSLAGYLAFALIYTCVAIMPAHEFSRLSDPHEHVIQLLQSHFLAIQTMMGPILVQERAHRPKLLELPRMEVSTARWAQGLCVMPSDSPLRKHLDWPDRLQRAAANGTLWNCIFEPGMPLYGGSI